MDIKWALSPLFYIHDISENDLRKSHDKLSQPRILFEQRNNIVIRDFIVGKIVTPE